MMNRNEIKNVRIVYYSGTGTTRKVAECFHDCLLKNGISVHTYPAKAHDIPRDETCLLILLFPVHAFNAPETVYDWLNGLPVATGSKAAVFSVSGGGEICPNTASRASSIKKLEQKGYTVIYEDMLVMPNNVLVAFQDDLAVKTLEVLPYKVEQIITDLLSSITRRTKPRKVDYLFSRFGELEKSGANQYGLKIKCGDLCTGCGWCEENCPSGNIEIIDGKPVFGTHCNMCLGCLYGCPQKALDPGSIKKLMIKEGFDLKRIENLMPLTHNIDIEKLAKGYLWSGVRKYLLENTVKQKG